MSRLSCYSFAHTETSYLPEHFLPEFLDLVVWGHEHECLIEPRLNPEMNFHVMQPGSSVATSLMPGEAAPKHVAILSITGRDFKTESIRLKSVRPFVMKEIVLADDNAMKKLVRKKDHRSELTRHLIGIVDELIEQAKEEWLETQEDADPDEEAEVPKPLIRLRVEYSAPDGGVFDCENPQRFSNRFVGKVANVNDVVQFHRKKASATRKTKDGAEMPEESVMAQLAMDSVKVEKLVREFLMAQSLTILPQNSFGDAVSQFVDKDDRHAMELFVNESLGNQFKHLMDADRIDDEDILNAMDQCKSKLEELFAAGHLKRTRKAKLKPKPDTWDSDLDGEWGDQPGALIHTEGEDEDEDDNDDAASVAPTRGRGKAAAAPKRAPAKKVPAKKPAARGRKTVVEDDDDAEEEDVMMDDAAEHDDEELFVQDETPKPTRASTKAAPAKKTAATRAPPKKASAATAATTTTKKAPTRTAAASTRQSQLNFSQAAGSRTGTQGRARAPVQVQEISDDGIEDDEDDDAFEPAGPSTARSTRSRR